jgi:photosystem II stability/assembly factor-like uncharacterized protein
VTTTRRQRCVAKVNVEVTSDGLLVGVLIDYVINSKARAWRLLALCLYLWAAQTPADLPAANDERAVRAPLVPRSLFLDGAAIGAHMVLVGERGHILVSRDAGISWAQSEVPTRVTLTGVTLHDHTRGWAVGHDAVILRTRDGGDSWETVYAAPEEERPLLDVWFEDPRHGIAVGAYGLFLETRDGGDTWQPRIIDNGDAHLNHIAAATSGSLYIAAEAGRVFRSDDGGGNWRRLPSPYAGSFFGTLPLDDTRVYLYGLRGHLFFSADSGEAWQAVETTTTSLLTNGIRIGADAVLFTGMGGTMLFGESSGAHLRQLQRAHGRGIAGALVAGDDALIVFGEFGVIRTPGSRLEVAQ